MKTQDPNSTPSHRTQKAASVSDMTVGSPLRQITKFALPLILGYILQQMYLVIDAVIVGRWIGVEALAAVGASTSITFLVMGFCNGACAGFAIPVAQAFGAKDYRKMRIYVANAVRVSAVIATVIMVLSLMSCHRILQMVNTPADIFHDAYTFLMLQFAAIPLTFGFNLLSGQIRALGNSRQPFYFLITSALVNILLDVVLILFCGMGVAGAGIATWLSQAVSVALCIWYIRKHMQLLIPQGDERRYDNRRTSILLNNGVPMGLQFSITAIGSIMLQSANNALGTACVAAFTAAMRIKMFVMCPLDGLGMAMATYSGQNYGAGKPDRIWMGIKSAILMMVIYSVAIAIVMWGLADKFALLFISPDETEIMKDTVLFLHINTSCFILLGLLSILRYSIQGAGYTRLSMFSGVSEMIARVLVSLILVPELKFWGVCLGDPTAWLFANLFLVPAFIYVYRRLKEIVAKEGRVPANA